MIREMELRDTERVLAMMRAFYSSDAVYTNGSDEIFLRDIETCVGHSPYAQGFVFEADGELAGYAMLAKSYSTEFGKPCIWIEDLFVLPDFRGQGFGGRFLTFVEQTFPDALLRLEAEEENEGAVRLYRAHGFDVLPYLEMKK